MTSPTSRSIPSDCASNGQEETGRLLPPASEWLGGKKCKPELQSEYIKQVFRDVMHQHCRAQKATWSQGTLHGLFPPTHKTLRELTTRVEGMGTYAESHLEVHKPLPEGGSFRFK